MEFTGTDRPALLYIKERGYASYSSLKLVRDKEIPTINKRTIWGDFGTAFHAIPLEGKKLSSFKLTHEEQVTLKGMLRNLKANLVFQLLMKSASTEVEFKKKILGLVLYGFIDILSKKGVADLKSTRHTSAKKFIAEMDFLQAAVYRKVTGLNDFYYIGVSKVFPYEVFVFNVNEFPKRIAQADGELNRLIDYIPRAIKKL
jgi:hypothetical protein